MRKHRGQQQSPANGEIHFMWAEGNKEEASEAGQVFDCSAP